jgi:hypothetical protein
MSWPSRRCPAPSARAAPTGGQGGGGASDEGSTASAAPSRPAYGRGYAAELSIPGAAARLARGAGPQASGGGCDVSCALDRPPAPHPPAPLAPLTSNPTGWSRSAPPRTQASATIGPSSPAARPPTRQRTTRACRPQATATGVCQGRARRRGIASAGGRRRAAGPRRLPAGFTASACTDVIYRLGAECPPPTHPPPRPPPTRRPPRSVWFFSRTPVAPAADLSAMTAAAKALRIDTAKMVPVVQAKCTYAGAAP